MGSLDIPAASRVYVDTSVIIYSIEKFPGYFSLLEPMWLDFERGKLEILSSELIKTPDAIHAATAVASSCTLLVSNDGDFRKLPALPVVILDDVLA